MSRTGSSSRAYEKYVRGSGYELADMEMVTDDLLQVVFYLDVRPQRVDDIPWTLALGIDRIFAWLDFYGHCHFRPMDIMFTQARCMLTSQKLRDRNKPPYRG